VIEVRGTNSKFQMVNDLNKQMNEKRKNDIENHLYNKKYDTQTILDAKKYQKEQEDLFMQQQMKVKKYKEELDKQMKEKKAANSLSSYN